MPWARAQPGAADLAVLERRAADKSVSAREREQATDQAIEARRALIAAAPDSDATVRDHLINQAAALLARPARDGADSAVLLGIALPAQVKSVSADATEAAECLARARRIAEALDKQFAANPPPPDDPRPGRLTQDRTVRIPFYRGRAESLLGALAPRAEAKPHLDAVVESLSRLALASPAPEHVRRVTYAAALLRRAADGDARAALEEFVSAATPQDPGGAVPAQTRVEGWMGVCHAAAQLGTVEQAVDRLHGALAGEPFTVDGRADPLWTVLGADAAASALTDQAVRTGRQELLSAAVTEQTALLARTDLGFGAESLRPLIYEKLGVLAARARGAGITPPPGMGLASAILAAREPSRRDEALGALAAVADAPGAGEFAAEALWERAVLLTQAGKSSPATRLEAARALTRLAREHKGSDRAPEAMNAALAYARTLEADRAPGAGGVYLDALALATTEFESLPEIDLWRVERARLLVPPSGETPPPETLLTALDQVRRVPPGSRVSDDARRIFERAQVAYHEFASHVMAEARRIGPSAAREAARQRFRPEAERAVTFAAAHKSPFLDRFRADLADAIVESGGIGARNLYDDLLKRDAAVPGGRPRLLLGLARARILAGDKAGGFGLLQDAAAALDVDPTPGQTPAPRRPEVFWHAWTLTLELLAEQNNGGDRTGAILAHIRRLETLDAGLGGSPWAQRIKAVKEGAPR